MSEGKSVSVVRPVEPIRSSSSTTTWLVVAGAAVLCGGVLALAFSGRAEHAQPTLADETDVAEVPSEPSGRIIADAPAAPMTLASASQSISIDMYTASWCSACRAAHRWMDREGIAYHEIDVDQQRDAISALSTLNPQRTLPTFDVDGQVLVGFDQIALTSAIDGAARRHR